MIFLRISDLLLSPPVTHTLTDWQVASDLQFANIVSQSIGDHVNLTSILLETPLDPAIKYYARGRVLLSTGYTAWSNIDIFQPQDVGLNNPHVSLPSLVTVPAISVTNNGVDVPTLNTTITVGSIDTLGGAKHQSTSYVLEDMSGKAIWNSLYDVADRQSKVIPAGIMGPNTLYRVRVMVHADSGDTSQVVTLTMKTESRTKGLIITGLNNIDSSVNTTVDVKPEAGVSGISATLYTVANTKMSTVNTYTATGALSNIITLLATDLRPSTTYILRINTNNASTWDQRLFTTRH